MSSVTHLKRSNPEAEGISSSAVLDFIRAVEVHDYPLDAVQGFMLLRHGIVAAEGWWAPYGPQSPHSLYSLSKSFTSTAIGLAVAERLLTVDDHVLTFFPRRRTGRSQSEPQGHACAASFVYEHGPPRRLRPSVSSEAAMTTGLALFCRCPSSISPARGSSTTPPPHTCSLPSSPSSRGSLCWTTCARACSDKLGIENPTWETDPRGVNIGGSGLHIKTEDIARFGQMYLQKGCWNGQRIVPEAWVAEATSAHSDNSNTQTNPDWTAGYGYQFWRCRHNCYRGDGAFGQFCVVMPEQDAVLAIISGVRDMQAVLDKVWQHLLPAMQPEALPADPQAYGELQDKLAALSLPVPKGQPSSPKAEQWSGKTYQLESNDLKLESVAITFGNERSMLTVRDERGEHTMSVGYDTWLKGTTGVRGRGDEPVAACGAWTTEDTYEVRVCYYEGELCPVLRFHYTGGELHLDVEPNVSWGPAQVTGIAGRLVGSVA